MAFKWGAAASIATAFSTDLNSLANGSFVVSSSAIDGTALLDLYIDIEVHLASLTPTAGGYFNVYILTSVDGTNYPDTPNTLDQPVWFQPLSTAAAAKHKTAYNILVPPLKFKLGFYSAPGVALASSGNTIKYVTHSMA